MEGRTAHPDFPPSAAGIPEDRQPAAWNHRAGETRLQTLSPGKKSFGVSGVPTSQEDSSPAGEGAQPRPRDVSYPLVGRAVGLIHGLLQLSHQADRHEMAGIRCTCPSSSPDFSRSLGVGVGGGGVSQFTPAKNEWNPA